MWKKLETTSDCKTDLIAYKDGLIYRMGEVWDNDTAIRRNTTKTYSEIVGSN